MQLYTEYKKFLFLKNELNLLKIRFKKIKDSIIKDNIGKQIVMKKDEIEKQKEYNKELRNIRNKELIEEYGLENYIRKDGQFHKLDLLEDDPIFPKILNCTNFFEGDMKIRMFVLTYKLNKHDITCESEGCNNQKPFNSSTNHFKTFCSLSHNDSQKIQQVKSIKTLEKKYGVKNQNQIKDLPRNNKVKHNVVNHHMQERILNKENLNKEFIIRNFIKDDVLLLSKMEDYFNLNKTTCYKKLQDFDITYKKQNRKELEISEYLTSLGVEFKTNDREVIKPLELDFVIESHKICIEFNGLYWHSYGLNNVNSKQNNLRYMKNRHSDKMIKAKEKGYQLFQIFENEWDDVKLRRLWKSQISNALHKNNLTIGARKCEIREIDNKTSNEFLINNHLQGDCQASVRIALFYKNEIISLMTFGKSRYDTTVDMELIRFCTKCFVQNPGAASKIIKYFERHYKPKGLISYANARWSKGNLYETIGFSYEGYSNPNYFYYHVNKPTLLLSRVVFQKHKLHKKLENFDAEKTEMLNMVEHNYRAIYDAGNYKYKKIYSDDTTNNKIQKEL